MKYGQLPASLGQHPVRIPEMMFYQYLPIKLPGGVVAYEDRLRCFTPLIGACNCNFVGTRGLGRFTDSYIYLTAKYMYQSPGASFNRPGWHSDGFMTDDINYVWSDCCPTVYNTSEFRLTLDDHDSLEEMQEQADPANDVTFPDDTLLRLDQFNIHRVGEIPRVTLRGFFKLTFSLDKYDLDGNAKNYLLGYDWKMRTREQCRNIPQLITETP